MTERDRNWNDWQWQLKEATYRIEDLALTAARRVRDPQLELAATQFPLFVTPYYRALADLDDEHCPIGRMFVPSGEELESAAGLVDDPIAEQDHSPLPGVVQRYPDRVLLLACQACAVHCRHCTRRHMGRGSLVPLDDAALDAALGYIADRPEIREVILSGGDPLLLEDDGLANILRRVRQVPTVEIIRIGTRVPVALPMRITPALADVLKGFHPLYINTHFNHPREVTAEAGQAVARLADAGIPVGNQTVLLKGVNDSPEVIEELFRALLRIRVRPYYLFMCDLWHGISHLRTSLDTGIRVMEHLRGRLSGIGIPQLVVDLPGGHGKVPISSDHVVERNGKTLVLRSPEGNLVEYQDV